MTQTHYIPAILVSCLSLAFPAFAQPGDVAQHDVAQNQDNELIEAAEDLQFHRRLLTVTFSRTDLLPQFILCKEADYQPATIPDNLAATLQQKTDAYVRDLAEATDLTPQQRQKIELLASLDRQRQIRQIAGFVKKYDGSTFRIEDAPKLQTDINDVAAAIQQGPGAPTQLLAKLLPDLLTQEQLQSLSQFHIISFSRAAARAAVLSEAERLKLVEYLSGPNFNFTGVSESPDRSAYLLPRLARLNRDEILTFLDARATAAVLRFAEHYRLSH